MVSDLFVLAFIIYQWRSWNKRGWPQVHNRAMLVYAVKAGEETARAERESENSVG